MDTFTLVTLVIDSNDDFTVTTHPDRAAALAAARSVFDGHEVAQFDQESQGSDHFTLNATVVNITEHVVPRAAPPRAAAAGTNPLTSTEATEARVRQLRAYLQVAGITSHVHRDPWSVRIPLVDSDDDEDAPCLYVLTEGTQSVAGFAGTWVWDGQLTNFIPDSSDPLDTSLTWIERHWLGETVASVAGAVVMLVHLLRIGTGPAPAPAPAPAGTVVVMVQEGIADVVQIPPGITVDIHDHDPQAEPADRCRITTVSADRRSPGGHTPQNKAN